MHLSPLTNTLGSVHNIELTYLMMHSRAGSIARPTWSGSIALDGLVSASESRGAGADPAAMGVRAKEKNWRQMELRCLELGLAVSVVASAPTTLG